MNKNVFCLVSLGIVALVGCDNKPVMAQDGSPAPENAQVLDEQSPEADSTFVPRNAYYGNLHIHTAYSFDAFSTGIRSTPTDAYEWAIGNPLKAPFGAPDVILKTPLDFYAVSDHSEYLGMFQAMLDSNNKLSRTAYGKIMNSGDRVAASNLFSHIVDTMGEDDGGKGKKDPELNYPKTSENLWKGIIEVADEYYRPGEFTTFPAFEWTSHPDGENLHRVVIFKDTSQIPKLPYSAFDSSNPEDLWDWMDGLRDKGAVLQAIPHNGNASNGRMFQLDSFSGEKIDKQYAQQRMRNESVYELSQIKGTSETYPSLSPNDEFANFEIWDYKLSAGARRNDEQKGGYLRGALLDGLSFQMSMEDNPFKYGVIGDSDSHSSAATGEEYNYTGKFAFEATAKMRMQGLSTMNEEQLTQVHKFSSAGIAGVWAEENTREGIYNAIARKETFATSGPRIRVRFFAGYDFTDADLATDKLAQAGYGRGVTMGGELGPGEGAPSFLVAAIKAPDSGNLDRIQIIKGWLGENGEQHEKIYNVAWSGDRQLGENGSLAGVGSTVDLTTATYTNSIGAPFLSVVWSDPDWDPKQLAFYYTRVLEIPTPRWTHIDAIKLGMKSAPSDVPATIQERAWSSAIWYSPKS